MKYLGEGAFRRVYDLGDGTVRKIAKHERGERHNLDELSRWEEFQRINDSHWLAAIVESSGGEWLDMLKAEYNLEQFIEAHGLVPVEALRVLLRIPDHKTANVGFVNGRWRAIDYA